MLHLKKLKIQGLTCSSMSSEELKHELASIRRENDIQKL
jgi:hypothetical protein